MLYRMSVKFFSLAVVGFAWLPLLAVGARAAETAKLDSEGYIRHWVMLAPIPLPEGESGADALYKEQLRNEAALRPKDGDKAKIGAKELTWHNIIASTNYFDFNAILHNANDHAAGYMVAYVESATEKSDVIIAVASNDEGRIYFNGVDIYAFNEPRTLMLDGDKGRITLKKGVNVIVFKVINEQNSWQGAVRLLDKAGSPLKDVTLRLLPQDEP